MQLNRAVFRDKVEGCWLGKNVGGAIGTPFEWRRKVNNVTFEMYKSFFPKDGTPVPSLNDDLDVQLLWIVAMEEMGIDVTAHRLAEYWVNYLSPHWAEYGTAKTSMRQGLPPPLSGIMRNPEKDSCGAYIRSEIWACLAPGIPELAAKYAYEDAILDHGDGEGTYAEMFTAALESAAFVVPTLGDAIDVGLSFIPKDCGVAKAVTLARKCFAEKWTWLDTRHEILKQFLAPPHEFCIKWMTEDDIARGFGPGKGTFGYEAPINVALTIVGLLWGGDDFGEVQCVCVNCGEDTDCTAATAGSIWGIMHGAKAIPEKWTKPLGRAIKTIVLNICDLGLWGSQLPQTVDELVDRTVALTERVQRKYAWDWWKKQFRFFLTDGETDLADVSVQQLCAKDNGASVWGGCKGPRYDFDLVGVQVDYGKDHALMVEGVPKTLKVTLTNRYNKCQYNLNLHWYLPEGWKVDTGVDGYYLLTQPYQHLYAPQTLEFTLTAEKFTGASQRAVLEITIPGRPTAMLVPLIFLNGRLHQGKNG